MTASQAAMYALLDQVLKWSLTVMTIVLIACIIQYSVYQPWWKDPIGRVIVLLEVTLLIFNAPLLASEWFRLSVSVAIVLTWILVGGIILTILALTARFFTWMREYRQFKRRPAEDAPTPGP